MHGSYREKNTFSCHGYWLATLVILAPTTPMLGTAHALRSHEGMKEVIPQTFVVLTLPKTNSKRT